MAEQVQKIASHPTHYTMLPLKPCCAWLKGYTQPCAKWYTTALISPHEASVTNGLEWYTTLRYLWYTKFIVFSLLPPVSIDFMDVYHLYDTNLYHE